MAFYEKTSSKLTKPNDRGASVLLSIAGNSFRRVVCLLLLKFPLRATVVFATHLSAVNVPFTP